MDETLEKLGTTTNYEKLNKRTVWIILGWSVTISLLNYCDYIRWHHMYDNLISICLTLIVNYCPSINIIDDLIFASILGLVNPYFIKIITHKHYFTNLCIN